MTSERCEASHMKAEIIIGMALVAATLVPAAVAHELFEPTRFIETSAAGDYISTRTHDDTGAVASDHWIDTGGAVWIETDEGFPCGEQQGTLPAPSACDTDGDGIREVKDMTYVDTAWGGSGILSGPGWWACKDDNRDTGNLHSDNGLNAEPHHRRAAWQSHSDAKAPHPNGEINPHVHVDDYYVYEETPDDVPDIAIHVGDPSVPGAQWAWPDYEEGVEVPGDEDYTDGICESAFPSAPNDVDLDDNVIIQCGLGAEDFEFEIWDVHDTREALINGTEVPQEDTWHFGDTAEGVAQNTQDGDFLASEPEAGHEDEPGIVVTFMDGPIFQPLDCGNQEFATAGTIDATWGG